jgi:hypothetical protein
MRYLISLLVVVALAGFYYFSVAVKESPSDTQTVAVKEARIVKGPGKMATAGNDTSWEERLPSLDAIADFTSPEQLRRLTNQLIGCRYTRVGDESRYTERQLNSIKRLHDRCREWYQSVADTPQLKAALERIKPARDSLEADAVFEELLINRKATLDERKLQARIALKYLDSSNEDVSYMARSYLVRYRPFAQKLMNTIGSEDGYLLERVMGGDVVSLSSCFSGEQECGRDSPTMVHLCLFKDERACDQSLLSYMYQIHSENYMEDAIALAHNFPGVLNAYELEETEQENPEEPEEAGTGD